MNDFVIKQTLTSDEILMIKQDFPDVTFNYIKKLPKELLVIISFAFVGIYIIFDWKVIFLFLVVGIVSFFEKKKGKDSFFAFLQNAHKVSVRGQISTKLIDNGTFLIILNSLDNKFKQVIELSEKEYEKCFEHDVIKITFLEKNSYYQYIFQIEKLVLDLGLSNFESQINTKSSDLDKSTLLTSTPFVNNLGYSEEPLIGNDEKVILLTQWLRIRTSLYWLVGISIFLFTIFRNIETIPTFISFIGLVLFIFGCSLIIQIFLDLYDMFKLKKAKKIISGIVLSKHCNTKHNSDGSNETYYSLKLDIGIINNIHPYSLIVSQEVNDYVQIGDFVEIHQLKDFDIYLNFILNGKSKSINKLARF